VPRASGTNRGHVCGEIAKRGHAVRLMNPRFVRPYVKSNKKDARDAAVYKVA
jgi:transposase